MIRFDVCADTRRPDTDTTSPRAGSKSSTAVDQETKDGQLRVASRFSHVFCGCFSHALVRPCGLSASSGLGRPSSSAIGQAESSGSTTTASDRTGAYRQKADRKESERCPLGTTTTPTWPYHRRQRVEESVRERTRLGQLHPRADRAVPARRQESVNCGRRLDDAATRSKWLYATQILCRRRRL